EIDAGGGDSDRGIVVSNNFGNTKVTANAKITANDGIVVLADGGNTDVIMNADILADDFGIAVDYDDDGTSATEVVNVTTAAGTTITSNQDGIFVDGDDGKVTVLVNGRIDSAGNVVDPGDSGDGIDVNTDAGDIDITLNAGNGIQPSGIRSDLDGIKANSSDANSPDLDGNVSIVANASIEAGLSGIRVEDGEIVSVDVGGGATVTGLGTTANAVVDLTADLGLTFNNFGTVHSNGADEVTQAADVAVDFAIDSIGDDNDIVFATLNNDGTITGRFDGSDVGDTFNNNSPNTWTFTGISDFEGGIDTFNNNSVGRVVNAIDFTSAETAQYISLENYVNSGEVSLVDQLPGDTFVRDRAYTDGDYISSGGTISVDVDLSQATPDSDRFIIGGDAIDGKGTETTFVSVNRIDQGPGGFTPLGIPVIEIRGDVLGSTNFELANGPIDTGFFTYDLFFTDDASPYTDGDAPGLENLANTNLGEGTNETIAINNLWVLASTLNQNAYGLPHVVAGANNLWNVSTGTWLERTADLRLGFAQGMIGDAATVNGLTLGADLAPEEAPVAPPVAMSTLRPGAWFKVYGGHDSRDVTATQSVLGGAGSVRFNDNLDQDYFGALGGIDTVVDAGPSAAWIFGIYGGYGHSSLDFDSGVSIDFEAASVGAYATYLNAGFFFDALFKADFGTADYNATASAGSFDTDYQSLGGVLDTGYRFDNANWFFEPKATLSYVSTDVDDAKGFGLPVSFDDGESLRGRLGARLGTSFVSGAAKWEPFVEASYWNEFSGDYAATISSAGTDVPVNYDAGGSYTEVAVGLNAVEIGGGWSAFAKGNFQFGEDDYTGQTYQGGIRFSF
ncbi:MAG TPA: autotransporter domain-containing protein, partial [Rhizobiaceae bacterium]|nr:autotransporter domain-containing protein [Rhizobiaceae bacterium]